MVMISFCVRRWRLGEQHPRFKEHVDASACKIGARGSCDVPILAVFQFDRARVGVRSRGWRGRRLSSVGHQDITCLSVWARKCAHGIPPDDSSSQDIGSRRRAGM